MQLQNIIIIIIEFIDRTGSDVLVRKKIRFEANTDKKTRKDYEYCRVKVRYFNIFISIIYFIRFALKL